MCIYKNKLASRLLYGSRVDLLARLNGGELWKLLLSLYPRLKDVVEAVTKTNAQARRP
jgi:hypothetical protein